jgi:hypothetical protein
MAKKRSCLRWNSNPGRSARSRHAETGWLRNLPVARDAVGEGKLIIIALTELGTIGGPGTDQRGGFRRPSGQPVDPDSVLALINLLGQNNTLPA